MREKGLVRMSLDLGAPARQHGNFVLNQYHLHPRKGQACLPVTRMFETYHPTSLT
jgi:hypothetical protein